MVHTSKAMNNLWESFLLLGIGFPRLGRVGPWAH